MDPFDDLLDEPAINRTARAGGKFQPKAKPRPRKGTSVSVPSTIISDSKEKAAVLPITDVDATQTIQPADTVDNKLNNTVCSSLATSAEEFLKGNEDLFSGFPNLADTTQSILVNPPSEAVATREDVGSIDALPSELAVSDINGDWHLSFRQSETEADSTELDVDPSADIFPEPTLNSTGSDAAPSVHAGDVADDRLDSLGLDLDPLYDDIIDPLASKSKAGGKFQPKTKSRSGNKTSTSVPSAPNATEEKAVRLTSTGLDTAQYAQPVVAENKLTNGDGMSVATSEIVGTQQHSKDNEGSFSDRRSLESIEASSKFVTGGDAGSKDAHAEVSTSVRNSVWHSSIGIFSSEVDSMGFELEPFGDVLPEAATRDSNNDGGGSLSPLEMPTLLACNNKDTNENFGIPACSSFDSLALRTCDAVELHTCPYPGTTQDTVSCREAPVSNKDGDIQIDNGRSETEFQEAGVFSGIETLDFISEANIASVRHAGKFQPKPNKRTRKEKPSTGISLPEVESIMHLQAPQLATSETGYMDEGSVPSFAADYPFQDNSMRFDDFIALDPTSEIPMNEELRNLPENSHSDGHFLGDILHRKDVPNVPAEAAESGKGETSTAPNLLQKCQKTATAVEENDGGKSSRQLRKRVACQLIDEANDEDNENGGFCAEPPSTSNVDEDYDDGYRVESTSQKKRAPRKSKKPEAENGKPVRKRKRANEVADDSTKEPPKKFSHSTRRNRGRVDKDLLETPWDEIDHQRLPIKDLILHAEYRERSASKEAGRSKTPLTNLRSYNSFNEESSYNREETFASEQGRGSDDDQPNYEVQPNETLINYQSFMDKAPSTRWSKQDTELFYEAVRQFGTDFSMIQQLFPSRTRHQVKLKFKKEERQYPVRLSEALTSRAKDHSHFQLVIDRLQEASQAEEHSNVEDSVGVTGEEEEEVVELTTQAKEEVAKPEQDEEAVKDQDVDFAGGAQSPVKADASDDEVFNWSQYKSDY
ncbi:uncharacterized protein LOC133881710 isoform X4 [Alnus glutinosa]|uniref:uncharacterized protein LOC133881710 isoform X4 n=1 Tax=Alnus glutinosa TaxID=3517 RepID=UPI002D77B3FA|nr:uncharacterized protein LOC133881710 isoform X4 [Alnus glutinosa]